MCNSNFIFAIMLYLPSVQSKFRWIWNPKYSSLYCTLSSTYPPPSRWMSHQNPKWNSLAPHSNYKFHQFMPMRFLASNFLRSVITFLWFVVMSLFLISKTVNFILTGKNQYQVSHPHNTTERFMVLQILNLLCLLRIADVSSFRNKNKHSPLEL